MYIDYGLTTFMGIFTAIALNYALFKLYNFSILSKLCIANGVLICGIFPFLFFKNNDVIMTLKLGTFFSLMLFISYVDYKTKTIPNTPLFLIGVLSIFINVWYKDYNYTFSTIVGLVVFGVTLSLAHLLTKGSIGMGDVKLIAITAFLFGISQVLSILFVTFLLSAFIGVFLIVFLKKDSKQLIPFGPIMLAGYSLCLILNFI